MESPYQSKILETLSFYEPMTWERLIVDFDEAYLKENPNFTKEGLEADLLFLKKKKLISITTNDKGEKLYQRLFPQKSWWQKLKRRFWS